MATDAPDEDQRPPIPEGWNGEPRLISFVIPLPVALSIPHHFSFDFRRRQKLGWPDGTRPPIRKLGGSVEDTDDDYVYLRVWRPHEKLTTNIQPLDHAMEIAGEIMHLPPRNGQRSPLPEPTDQSWATVIEAVTPLVPVRDGEKIDVSRTVDAAFDKVMEHIVSLSRAYVKATAAIHVPALARQSLFVVFPFSTRSPLLSPGEAEGDEEAARSAWSGVGLYRPNQTSSPAPRDTGTMTQEQLDKMLVLLDREEMGDPYAPFVEHSLASQRAFTLAPDYATAAIEAQTASEILLDAVLLTIAWEEDASPEIVANWFDESLSKRVRTHYGPRLGGSWDTTNDRAPIGRWARHTRDLRNKVIHAGYRPTEHEVVASLDGASGLETHVKARLLENRNTYPRATLMLIGMAGLEKRGLLKGQIKRFIDEVAAAEPSWIRSYSAWANSVEAERSKR